jgi:hypothetical protein
MDRTVCSRCLEKLDEAGWCTCRRAEELEIKRRTRIDGQPVFSCIGCGAQSPQAWIDELCEECVGRRDAKGLKNWSMPD